jgi:hypothetical protein
METGMSFLQKRDVKISLCAALLAASPQYALAAPKPPIAGFIDMQTIKWHNKDDGQPHFTLRNVKAFPGMFGGIVFNGTWAEMQQEDGARLDTTRLDEALETVRAYNAHHPTAPLGVKLRIYSGNQAPEWAKDIAGGPVTINRNPLGCQRMDKICPITIGKVWDPRYIAKWRAFQRGLAAKYDREPLIRAVAITSCAMETDEPFVMPATNATPPSPYPTGYTDAAGKDCLRGAVDDYSAWHTTPIDYTINPFQRIQRGGAADVDFSISVMRGCRAALKERCELGNHALNTTMPLANTDVVEAIAGKGGPIHYQTVGPNKKGFGWKRIVLTARQYNATGLELWPDAEFNGFMTLTMSQMRALRELFDGN